MYGLYVWVETENRIPKSFPNYVNCFTHVKQFIGEYFDELEDAQCRQKRLSTKKQKVHVDVIQHNELGHAKSKTPFISVV